MKFSVGLRGAGTALGCLLLAASAGAQAPQAVRLVVGYTAGGPVDSAARLIAPRLARELGVTVLVDNRPGSNAALAGDIVSKAPPDGATLFFAASPTITISPHVQKKMPFDPAKDLTPISPVVSYANVLVVNKDQPFQTVAELLTYARANPGKVTYGSAGMGSSNHLSGELLAAQTRTQLTHIPYKGSAPALNDVVGGQLTMMFDIPGQSQKFISTGRIRPLAVTSRERNDALPGVPTMREAGLPGYEVIGWFALYGPPRMAPELVARYNEAMRKVLALDDVRSQFVAQGYDTWIGSPQVLADQAAKDREMWRGVTKGIEIE